MARITMREAISQALMEEMDRDPSVFILGEEVGVAILPNDGMTLTPEELWAFLDAKIAKFKIPTQVVIMTEPLPRNAAGKFLKRELQQHVVKGTLKAASR